MANFGKVEKITREIGGRVITFRSKLEYRWAIWTQLRKEQGIIVDWQYEADQVKVKTKLGEIKIYRPDFTIEYRCKTCLGSGERHCKLGMCVKKHARITCSPKGKRCEHYSPGMICQSCKGSGKRYEYEETKGWFTSKDYTKMKLFTQQYDNPLTLIFAGLTNCKSARLQYGRAKRLEKLLEANGGRVIFDANKTIFVKIKHLF